MLDQIAGAVASFTGEGGYDQNRVYDSVAKRHPDAAVVVPPRTSAVPSDTVETAPTHHASAPVSDASCIAGNVGSLVVGSSFREFNSG